MKSFAGRVRDSLTREGGYRGDSAGSRRAELTGLALSCGSLTLSGGGKVRLAMRTEHAGTGRWIVRLLRREFEIIPSLRILRASRLGGRTTFEIRLEEEDSTRVAKVCGISPLDMSVPKHCLKNKRSREAFLRGMFLGCATIADPESGYQLDFVLSNERTAQSFVRFLHSHYEVSAAINSRRQAYVVYTKTGDGIITLLSAIGAHGAILDYENVRIMKDARNRANRAANCDSGNITKMLGAAERQMQAITLIEETIGLEALPESLREIAQVRREHEDLPLEALGAMLEPPMGKSGVYHRLSRIEAIARSIGDKEEEGI